MHYFPKSANSKYYAKKSPCLYGHIHASIKEANRCNELHLMEKAGEISELCCQKDYELIPAQYRYEKRVSKKGKPLKDKKVLLERSCIYKADFTYKDKSGNPIVEDCKGKRTKEYIIKRKLMLYIHGIKLKET